MDFVDLFFPKKCVGCGKWGKYVCEECEVGMWEEEQICPACGRNSRYGLRHEYCKNKGYLDGASCLWAYEGLARKLISGAKYKFYFDYLSELLNNVRVRVSVSSEYAYLMRFVNEKPVVVSVPLFVKRERERGFNQASIIAKSLAAHYGLSLIDNWLLRIKDTGQQVGRSRQERLAAMEGAFKINEKLSFDYAQDSQNPLKILLVDDVWTTGATMQECAKVLKKAGAKQVWGWVLAR